MNRRVRVIDKGLKALMARAKRASAAPVRMTVGVHADAGRYPNGMPVTAVAWGQ
jgi:hypothetical protein